MKKILSILLLAVFTFGTGSCAFAPEAPAAGIAEPAPSSVVEAVVPSAAPVPVHVLTAEAPAAPESSDEVDKTVGAVDSEEAREPEQAAPAVQASAATAAPAPSAAPQKSSSQRKSPEPTPTPAPSMAPEHVHDWTAVTETVHHDAVTEQVKVVDVPATEGHFEGGSYDVVVCYCGAEFTTAEAYYAHSAGSFEHGGFSTSIRSNQHWVEGTPEVSHYETVIVSEAWDEEVVAGYVCASCGERK